MYIKHKHLEGLKKLKLQSACNIGAYKVCCFQHFSPKSPCLVESLATKARYSHCTMSEDAFYFKYLETITENTCMAKLQLNGTNRFWILQTSHQSASQNHSDGTHVL